MDKDVIRLVIGLVITLIRSSVLLAKTLEVPDEQLDEVFNKAKEEFIKNDPENLPELD